MAQTPPLTLPTNQTPSSPAYNIVTNTHRCCHYFGLCESILARFDCDLSIDVDEIKFKRNNLRFNASTYFQRGVGLSQGWRERIQKEREDVDHENKQTA